jgi:DNA-3-methyladenine glycosylase
MENSLISWSRKDWAKVDDKRVLPRSFYERDTVQVARDLLGKILITRTRSGLTAGRIVETEAYHGTDPASHSSRGETPRCSIMFGEPGVAYVYFIYGMYEMLNFVTEPKGYPGAVLIRALEPVAGETLMRRRRKVRARHELTAGPGRLTQALGVKMSHNGLSLMGPELFVMDDGFCPESVSVSPRVGISNGNDRLWRFFITGNHFVSRAPQNKQSMRI